MSDKTERIVDGFCYTTKEEADLAMQEELKAKSLAKKLEGCDLAAVKSIYERAIMNRTFRTPAGHKYLYQLRQALIKSGVSESELTPIPLLVKFAAVSPLDLNKMEIKPKVETTKPKKKASFSMGMSVLLNIVLLIAVMAMFMISLYSDNPNILNYKKQITNEYSSWEQELQDKEKELRAWEKELTEREASEDKDRSGDY